MPQNPSRPQPDSATDPAARQLPKVQEPASSPQNRVASPGLDPARLDAQNYTLSLLQQGVAAGLATAQQEQAVQLFLVGQLGERISDYTNGKSSSVPEETAAALSEALLYCTDACLKHFSTPEQALAALCQQPQAVYRKGVRLVEQAVLHCKQLLQQAVQTAPATGHDAYHSCLQKQIPAYLHDYKTLFCAALPFVPEYPLAAPLNNNRGALALQTYLRRLCLENEICAAFPVAVESLEQAWRRQNHAAAGWVDENLCALGYRQLLCRGLLGLPAEDLLLNEPQYQALKNRLLRAEPGDASDASGREKQVVEHTLTLLHLEQELPQKYLRALARRLVPLLRRAAGAGEELRTLVLVRREDTSQN